jgi:hypothetical protein
MRDVGGNWEDRGSSDNHTRLFQPEAGIHFRLNPSTIYQMFGRGIDDVGPSAEGVGLRDHYASMRKAGRVL